MFVLEQIRSVFQKNNLNYVLDDAMDYGFCSVFVDYDATTSATKDLKTDFVLDIVKDHLRSYVTAEASEAKDLPIDKNDTITDTVQANMSRVKIAKDGLAKVAGFFWYVTQKAIGPIMQNVVKLSLWLLENPYYLRMALMTARIIRIVLCVVSSFPDMATQILDGLLKHIQDKMFGYGMVILTFARRILECINGLYQIVYNFDFTNTKAWTKALGCLVNHYRFILDTIWHYIPESGKNMIWYSASYFQNTIENMGGFLARGMSDMLISCGCPLLVNFTKVMTGAEAEHSGILGLDKHATTAENIRTAFNTWDIDLMDLNVVLLILDTLITCIDIVKYPIDSTRQLVDRIFRYIPVIGPIILKAITMTLAKGLTFKLNVLRLVLVFIRRLWKFSQYRGMILDVIAEIKAWFTDLFPCLFRVATDALINLMTFGKIKHALVAPADNITSQLEPPCCLAPIIRTLQRQLVFGELDRRNNIAAQDLRVKRSEVSWWDYMASGEAYKVVEKEEQDLRIKRRALQADENRQGGRLHSYTTRGLGDTIYDSWKTYMMGATPSLESEQRHVIVCMPHSKIQATRIFGNALGQADVQTANGPLRFYLCFHDNDYQWHASAKEVRDTLYTIRDETDGSTLLPVNDLPFESKMLLAQMHVPLYYK